VRVVTKYHKKHRNEIGISSKTEAYIQSLVIKKEHFFLSNDDDVFKDDYYEVEALVSNIVETSKGEKQADIQK
jgi:hypothetical protein